MEYTKIDDKFVIFNVFVDSSRYQEDYYNVYEFAKNNSDTDIILLCTDKNAINSYYVVRLLSDRETSNVCISSLMMGFIEEENLSKIKHDLLIREFESFLVDLGDKERACAILDVVKDKLDISYVKCVNNELLVNRKSDGISYNAHVKYGRSDADIFIKINSNVMLILETDNAMPSYFYTNSRKWVKIRDIGSDNNSAYYFPTTPLANEVIRINNISSIENNLSELGNIPMDFPELEEDKCKRVSNFEFVSSVSEINESSCGKHVCKMAFLTKNDIYRLEKEGTISN